MDFLARLAGGVVFLYALDKWGLPSGFPLPLGRYIGMKTVVPYSASIFRFLWSWRTQIASAALTVYYVDQFGAWYKEKLREQNPTALQIQARLDLAIRAPVSAWLDRHSQRFPDEELLRTKYPAFIGKPSKDNGHAEEAAARSNAERLIEMRCQLANRPVYSIAQSSRDQRSGVDGERLYYTAHDLGLAVRERNIGSRHVIKMIDVDFWLPKAEMDLILATGLPIMLYTFLPRALSMATTNGRFYAIEDNYWRYDLPAGGAYEHQLWRYSVDEISVCTYNSLIVYQVEAHTLDDSCRAIVTLMPRVAIRGILPVMVAWLMGLHRPLKRLEVDIGKRINLLHELSDPPRVHIQEAGGEDHVVPLVVHETLLNMKSVTGGCVSRILTEAGAPKVQIAQRVAQLYNTLEGIPPITFSETWSGNYTPEVMGVRNHEAVEVGQFWLREAGGRDLIPGTCAPTRGEHSDISLGHERVMVPRNLGILPVSVQREFDGYLQEFVDTLLPDQGGKMHPISFEELDKLQDRSTQRASYREFIDTVHVPFDDPGECFQKGEAYGGLKPPRNINNVVTQHRIRWGTFTYPATDVLKATQWYGFGHDPVSLDALMCDRAQRAGFAVDSDYSKYDGSLHIWLRCAERSTLLRLFDTSYYDEITYLFGKLIFQPMRANSTRLPGGAGRRSGSGDTSFSNSFSNALMSYIALRRSGLTITKAWQGLGIYGGDDGVNFDLPAKYLQQVVKELQMDIKLHTIVDGPVPFLGRVWVNPFRFNGSVIDVKRCLQRFGYTGNRGTTPEVVGWRKGVSMMVTDSKTPLVGILAYTCLSIFPKPRFCDLGRKKPWIYEELTQISHDRLSNSDLVSKYLDNPIFPAAPHEEAESYVAFVLGVSIAQLRTAEDAIASWTKVQHFAQLFDSPLDHGVAAVIDAGPVAGRAPPPAPEVKKAAAEAIKADADPKNPVVEAIKPCRDYQRGLCTRKKCKFSHLVPIFCLEFSKTGQCAKHKDRECKNLHLTCTRADCKRNCGRHHK